MASFVALMSGWVLDLRRHTVTEVVRAAGAVGLKHISSYHRFFSQARWVTDEIGLTLAALVIERLVPNGVIRLVVDDTVGRHTGKRIAGASMHRDPLLSTGRRPFFHWGHEDRHHLLRHAHDAAPRLVERTTFDPASSPSDLRKHLRPLVDYVASAA